MTRLFSDLSQGATFSHEGVRYYKETTTTARPCEKNIGPIEVSDPDMMVVVHDEKFGTSLAEAFDRLNDFNHDR
tara:strand:+ start:3552 stop:3773 length:222 start_codon:yes stop_codon:yes gene_type:complete